MELMVQGRDGGSQQHCAQGNSQLLPVPSLSQTRRPSHRQPQAIGLFHLSRAAERLRHLQRATCCPTVHETCSLCPCSS